MAVTQSGICAGQRKKTPLCCVVTAHHMTYSTFCLPGSEWRYVIISTVCSLPSKDIEKEPDGAWCSKHLGFVGDPNQINVAITRAKEGLCIIGKIQQLLSFFLLVDA